MSTPITPAQHTETTAGATAGAGEGDVFNPKSKLHNAAAVASGTQPGLQQDIYNQISEAMRSSETDSNAIITLINQATPNELLWVIRSQSHPYNMRYSLLHIAAEKCSIDVVRALLEKQPTLLHELSAGGANALYYAARGNNTETVDLLISKGLLLIPYDLNWKRVLGLSELTRKVIAEGVRQLDALDTRHIDTEDFSKNADYLINCLNRELIDNRAGLDDNFIRRKLQEYQQALNKIKTAIQAQAAEENTLSTLITHSLERITPLMNELAARATAAAAEGIIDAILGVRNNTITDPTSFAAALNEAIVQLQGDLNSTTTLLNGEDQEVINLFYAARKSEQRGFADAYKAGSSRVKAGGSALEAVGLVFEGLKFAILAFCEWLGEKRGLPEAEISYLQAAIIEKVVELMPEEHRNAVGTHTKNVIAEHNKAPQNGTQRS